MNIKELRCIKDEFFTGLTLLGFKSIQCLKLQLFLSPASFIYPDDDLIKGNLWRIPIYCVLIFFCHQIYLLLIAHLMVLLLYHFFIWSLCPVDVVVNLFSVMYHVGSKIFMAALLHRCNARNVAAICSLKSTAASKPCMVALLPQLLQQDTFGQCLPEGFHVIFLPYSDDIRNLNVEDLVGGTSTT